MNTKKNIQIIVLALIRNKNKYLLTLRNDSYPDFHNLWQLPGGSLEFGEKPETTLRREIKEELSVEINEPVLIPYFGKTIRGNWHGFFITFLCSLKNPSSKIILNKEASDYRWVTYQEMDTMKLFDGIRELIIESEKIGQF